VTLGVAALTMLPPLQEQLREQAQRDLEATVLSARGGIGFALREGFEERPQPVAFGPRCVPEQRDVLPFGVTGRAYTLDRRTDARVIIADTSCPVAAEDYLYDSGAGPDDPRDILQAYIRGRTVIGATEEGGVRIATPLDTAGRGSFVLAVRRSSDDAAGAVGVVRGAFLVAAAVGLAVALLLGLLLVTGLTRRLERLRTTAVRIAAEGPGAPPPRDDTADEIGDLARSLARMQIALGRQEEARRAFVATASHELRTPLTSLGGTLELLAEDLQDGRLDPDDIRDQVALARQEVGRLTQLASDLLDLSRLDAESPLRAEPVELVEVVRAVTSEFLARAREIDVEVDVVEPPGPVWARADPSAAARITRILLDNALRFTPPGSVLRVLPAYHGDAATLEVADAGPGVPVAERERIFARFERGSSTGGEGGFGLGLAIGRELAERLGGRLELREVPGPGATFRLTLPLEDLGGDA
jgi:signal transduction histidine kinase